MRDTLRPFAGYKSRHFAWSRMAKAASATLTLNRPERKNPLTFDSYAELRDLFRALAYAERRATRSCSPAQAATSAPAATCTRSSAR